MKRFNPNDEEMALISLIFKRVIYINSKGAIEATLEVDQEGLRLFVILPNEPQISWNRCEAASTEEELRNMDDWLLEQERKVIETR